MGIEYAIGPAGQQPGICTSSTRPANPYQGQLIYETDTFQTLQYTTTTTGWRPPWNTAWGAVVPLLFGSTLIPQSTTGVIDLAGTSQNVNLVGKRRYLVEARCLITSTVLSDYAYLIVDMNAFTQDFVVTNIHVAGNQHPLHISTMVNWPLNGTYVAKLQYGRYFGSGTISGRHDIIQPTILITDVGPWGLPL